MKTNFLSLRTT